MSTAKATQPSTSADIRSRLAATFAHDTPNPAVCVADGYGVKVTVDGRHLVVADGFGPTRRVRRYARATHGLHRIVVIGASGMVSIEALRWCAGTGVSVVVLNASDASVLSTSGACALDDGRLRRQALAMTNSTGLEIAKYLTTAKLAGQRLVAASELGADGVADSIEAITAMVADAGTLEEVRQLEASAANLYWSAWEAVELRFARRPPVPAHWRGFAGRRSAVNPGTARNATDSVNALLNYSYRLLEAEGRLATLMVGLDPGLGVLHADMRSRDGFVLDLIETVRPIADRHVARMAQHHVFVRRDFAEDARGVVRVLPPLSHRLAEVMPSYGAALAPVVEHVVELLGSASPYDMSTPSVLTHEKHRAASRRRVADTPPSGETAGGTGPGASGLSPRIGHRQLPNAAATQPPLPLPACVECGGALPREPDRLRRRGEYCTSCLPVRRKEIGDTHLAGTQAGGTASPETSRRRSAANSRHRLEEQIWELAHDGEAHDRERYLREVLPGLAGVSLTAIARATGMSTSAASKIRSGKRVPHPRWWTALSELRRSP
jgi:CRISPR-associated protein Cas1